LFDVSKYTKPSVTAMVLCSSASKLTYGRSKPAMFLLRERNLPVINLPSMGQDLLVINLPSMRRHHHS
jgi:hypothetical protein